MAFIILIPAYQPDEALIALINELRRLNPQQYFIVVNDGSNTPTSKKIVDQLAAVPSITLLTHETNQGKGKALKTGLDYFVKHFPDKTGVVTADADGQHVAEDILRVGNTLTEKNTFVLGVRKFSASIPFRSRFGNEWTRKVFRLFSGVSVEDTQTGLRGLVKNSIPDILSLPANGYEFEMQMLMHAALHQWPIKQVPIKTVYINQNRSSHFSPFRDTVKIHAVILKYFLRRMTRFFKGSTA